jgi:hypothetical protein
MSDRDGAVERVDLRLEFGLRVGQGLLVEVAEGL